MVRSIYALLISAFLLYEFYMCLLLVPSSLREGSLMPDKSSTTRTTATLKRLALTVLYLILITYWYIVLIYIDYIHQGSH